MENEKALDKLLWEIGYNCLFKLRDERDALRDFVNRVAEGEIHYDCGGCDDCSIRAIHKKAAMALSPNFVICLECGGSGRVTGKDACEQCYGYGHIERPALNSETKEA